MVSNAFLTAAQPAVAGELQCPLGAVPAVPGELKLALLDAALRPGRHAAGVDEIGLGAEQRVRRGDGVCPASSPPLSPALTCKTESGCVGQRAGTAPWVTGWECPQATPSVQGSHSAALVSITSSAKLV